MNKQAAATKAEPAHKSEPNFFIVIEAQHRPSAGSVEKPWLGAPIAAPVLAAILGAILVHSFTKRREHQKWVADHHARLEKRIDDACNSAALAWTSPAGPSRNQAIEATLWKVQLVGQMLANLQRRLNKQCRWVPWRWQTVGYPFGKAQGRGPLTVLTTGFRQILTAEPFQDSTRAPDEQHALSVENARGELINKIETIVSEWPSKAQSDY